ncbi:MAG: MAPEG family protein [Alphaproteobacteria bacterium]|nr:MAPEG family protein [Alphaproteobacteria bacterium]MBV9370883.1 MAPEG family protein [Alphaproteobacteria bacterium]MBV9899673.1 MAPEG family protein [Alphaproteobacteria bacterium]
MILPISLTIAGAAALLNLWIARRVGQARVAHKVSIGDGGQEALTARMRAHSNYVEYTPFFLVLLVLTELAVGQAIWLWAVGALYMLGRVAHAFGMDRPLPDRLHLRMIGIGVTLLVLFGLAVVAIALAYMHPGTAHGLRYAALAHD